MFPGPHQYAHRVPRWFREANALADRCPWLHGVRAQKEGSIEPVHISHKAAPTGVGFAHGFWVGVEISIDIKSRRRYSVMASRPSVRSSHRGFGPLTPPGNRHAMDTTAMGSSLLMTPVFAVTSTFGPSLHWARRKSQIASVKNKNQCGGKTEVHLRRKPVAKFHAHQGINAQFNQRLGRNDALTAREPQHLSHLVLQKAQKNAATIRWLVSATTFHPTSRLRTARDESTTSRVPEFGHPHVDLPKARVWRSTANTSASSPAMASSIHCMPCSASMGTRPWRFSRAPICALLILGRHPAHGPRSPGDGCGCVTSTSAVMGQSIPSHIGGGIIA